MKKTIFVALGLLVAGVSLAQEKFLISANESSVNWVGEKVTGSHNGTIDIKSGELSVSKKGVITGGSFTIDMASIDDLDLSGEYKDKLVGHLKSPDFFSIEEFPESTLEITRVVEQGAGKLKITGNITIKGITKEIKFPATIVNSGKSIEAKAEIVIDRSEFNVRYGSGSFFDGLGDKVIYDDFTLTVAIVAQKDKS